MAMEVAAKDRAVEPWLALWAKHVDPSLLIGNPIWVHGSVMLNLDYLGQRDYKTFSFRDDETM
jgi:hypothetical protein